MGRRPGRKRNQGVKRHPCGQINDYVGMDMPPNVEANKVLEERGTKPGETRHFYRPQTLDWLGLTESQKRAAEEFAALASACSKYAWGSPRREAKPASLQRGKTNRPELDLENVVSLGEKFHDKYLETVNFVQAQCPRGSLGIMVKVCVENKTCTERDLVTLWKALDLLAAHWHL